MTTHAELFAAVTEARMDEPDKHPNPDFALEWNAHLDTLAAILNAAEALGHDGRRVRHRVLFPIVADALRKMGAL